MARVLLTLLIAVLAGLLVIDLATAFFTASHSTTGTINLAPSFEPERIAVVFLRGLGSSLSIEELRKIVRDNECQDDEAFGAVIQVLQTHDSQKYQCDNFLFFSYHRIEGTDPPRSGFVVLGEWTPAPYECSDTGQSLVESGELLRNMLKAYQDYWESEGQKVKFILVGHSLGGLLAFMLLEDLRSQIIEFDITVSHLVTLDSPIGGAITTELNQLRWLIPQCREVFLASEAADDLFFRFVSGPTLTNTQTVEWANSNGIKVLTLGNWDDCVYSVQHCFSREPFHFERIGLRPRLVVDEAFPDTALTQIVRNAEMRGISDGEGNVLYDFCNQLLPLLCGWGHGEIKERSASDVADFIEMQSP